MSRFLDKILMGSKFAALELFPLNGKDMSAFIEVARKKDELTIVESFICAVEELRDKQVHPLVALVLNNSNVLTKEVAGSEPEDHKLLHKAFPNLDLKDFYYEIWRKDTVSIISICRKSYIENVVEELSTFTVISIHLGIPVISNLIGVSGLKTLSTTQQKVDIFAERDLISLPQAEAAYDLNGLQLQNHYTLGFSAILQLMQQPKTAGSIRQYSMDMLEQYRQKRYFKSAIKISLSVMLSLLIVNFLLFNYYYNKVANNAQEIEVNKSELERIAKLHSSIKEKELELSTLLSGETQRAAVVVNSIVSAMPESISLIQLNVQPLEKKIKEDTEILVEKNTIILSGTTIDNNAFSKWIDSLENMKIAEKLIVNQFSQQTGNIAAFSITIKLRNIEAQQKK